MPETLLYDLLVYLKRFILLKGNDDTVNALLGPLQKARNTKGLFVSEGAFCFSCFLYTITCSFWQVILKIFIR